MHLEWHTHSQVPPEKARQWWFDLREDDHEGHAFTALHGEPDPADGREILRKTDEEVLVRDTMEGGKIVLETLVHKQGRRRLIYDGDGKLMADHFELRFEPTDDGGSEIHFEGDLRFKGFGKLLAPFMRGKLRRMITEDMALHAEEMEEEWQAEPWA